MVTLALLGGPLDGAQHARCSQPDPLVWVDAAGRCWTMDGKDRSLYQFAKRTTRAGSTTVYYRFVGYHIARCSSCGWFGPKHATCALCHHPLTVPG
jgi:hypothetical protein